MNHEMNDGRMMRALVLALGVVIGVAPVAMAAAQSAPAAPAPVEPEKKKQALPDLDDLLGIPSKPKQPPVGEGELPPEPGAEDVKDSTALELERQLSAEEMAQKFDEAVRQMAESADRIEKAGDVGIATQRLHEAILRNLDVLIKQSQNNSSSSSSQQQKQQQQADQAGQQKPTSQQQQNQQPGQAENKGQENMPPEMVEAERKGRLETARAAWGNLPERVRESLLQGSSDYFSALYESMTEAYYKKIAEEGEE